MNVDGEVSLTDVEITLTDSNDSGGVSLVRGTVGLSASALEQHLREAKLPSAGVDYVMTVASSPPERLVGRVRKRNIIFEVPLPRFHAVLQAESGSGEYPLLLRLAADLTLVAIFDQPTSLPVQIVDSIGRQTRTWYTADYLVAQQGKVIAYEVKADSELEDLCRSRPSDWINASGSYKYRPAFDAFALLGIEHIVVATSQLSGILSDNLRTLVSVKKETSQPWHQRIRKIALELVQHHHVIRIGGILDHAESDDATPILQLIAEGRIHADLEGALLSFPREVWVASSASLAKGCTQSQSELSRALKAAGSDACGDLCPPRYAGVFAMRYALATTGVNNREVENAGEQQLCSPRTVRRYQKLLRDAQGNPKVLIPSWNKCGRTGRRTSEMHHTYLAQYIHNARSSPSHKSIDGEYAKYQIAFEKDRAQIGCSHERPISKRTFYRRWKSLSGKARDAAGEGGRRLHNEAAASLDPSKRTLIASRPFSVAHIDHYLTDIFLKVGSYKGKPLTRRPWITAMIDSYTDEILAFWISFSSPSRKSCAMILRECVRRHGRLPELLVVDGGSDFQSTFFAYSLAALRVTKAVRPPEDPRFGSEVERVFLNFKQRYCRGLPGFGLSIHQARKVSGAFKAEKNASLDLANFIEIFDLFISNGHNGSPKLGQTHDPITRRIDAMRELPFCGIPVEFGLEFIILTSIDASSEKYTLVPGRGVHVLDTWFTSDRLARIHSPKRDVHVRLEPFDHSIVYVFADDKWMICRSQDSGLGSRLSTATLIGRVAGAHDLRAIRRELCHQADLEVVRQMNERLQKVQKESSSAPHAEDTPATDEDEIEWGKSDASMGTLPSGDLLQ